MQSRLIAVAIPLAYDPHMALPIKQITRRSIILSLLASALIWLPLINSLAANIPIETNVFGLVTTILADVGICALIWLNWAIRRNK